MNKGSQPYYDFQLPTGGLPSGNSWLVFSGGIGVNAKQPDAGRALLKFLATPAALAVFKANGLEPP